MPENSSPLDDDLASERFLHGVNQGFWELESREGARLSVWMYAADDRRYLLVLDCDRYRDEPIGGRFVDPASRQCVAAAWPRGDGAFPQWVKFEGTSENLFICWDQDRFGIQRHPDWHARRAWTRSENSLCTYLNFVRRLLHQSNLGYSRVFSTLSVPRQLLDRTIAGLRHRSAGKRESAAVWAGQITADELGWQAEDVVFYHDICDDKASLLSLELSEDAKFALYESISDRGHRLVALIHTHPGDWVGLSLVDQRNQLSSRIGFWSLVVPHFAEGSMAPTALGVHVRTRHGWHQLAGESFASRLRIE